MVVKWAVSDIEVRLALSNSERSTRIDATGARCVDDRSLRPRKFGLVKIERGCIAPVLRQILLCALAAITSSIHQSLGLNPGWTHLAWIVFNVIISGIFTEMTTWLRYIFNVFVSPRGWGKGIMRYIMSYLRQTPSQPPESLIQIPISSPAVFYIFRLRKIF